MFKESFQLNFSQFATVVMERDGSISVLKAGENLDPYLLKGVKGHPSAGKKHVEPPLHEEHEK
jgi:hypothetical protein